MRLKKLELLNIRSYLDAHIDFPSGSLLLSGDIGSGKSTILQAIEFALFGAIRGQIDAGSLLRSGMDKGSVVLELDCHGPLRIQRILQRTKKSVTQGNVALSFKGVQEELSTQQATTRILTLLGYPADALRSSLFRYTVYCSQEDMKAILREDSDKRLESLRMLFGVDKYKLAAANTSLILSKMRGDVRELKGQVKDTDTIKERLHTTQHELDASKKSLISTTSVLTKQEDKVNVAKHNLDDLKTKVDKQNEAKVLKSTLEQQLKQLQLQISTSTSQIDVIREDLVLLKKFHTSINKPNMDELDLVKKQCDAKQSELNKEIQSVTTLQNQIQHINDTNERIQKQLQQLSDVDVEALTAKTKDLMTFDATLYEKLKKLLRAQGALQEQPQLLDKTDTCPTCRQPISEKYYAQLKETLEQEAKIRDKKLIALEQSIASCQSHITQMEDAQKQRDRYMQEAKHAAKTNAENKKRREELQQHIKNPPKMMSRVDQLSKELHMLEEKMRGLEQLHKAYTKSLEDQEKITSKQKEIDMITQQQKDQAINVKEIQSQLASLHIDKQIETEYAQAEQRFKQDSLELQNSRVAQAKQEQEVNQLQKNLKQLELDLESRQKYQEQIMQKDKQIDWGKHFFIPLLETIEQHVFGNIYVEFNDVFVRWFSMLIEDETLVARLDSSFNPVIEQNGYDMDIEQLSGGEKTCVALAYRLALNRVINELIEDVHTKDVLILDEPTDGFSSEQLDRVKQVLNEIGIQQLIVVSHEPKMASFVEHTLHITKLEHQSSVSH